MKRAKLLFILTLLVSFVMPFSSFAATDVPEVKADTTVSALVPTTAYVPNSSIVSNVVEILSDASQKAIITVKIKNFDNIAIPDAEITLTSKRGAIDKINQVDASGNVLKSGDGQGLSVLTDANGFLFFQVFSSIPGESFYSARVDSQLDLGQVKITFLPLPFPKNISVVVEVPKMFAPNGEITVFKPKNYDIDREKLVNLTMELTIPIWVFYLVAFLMLANIIMFLTIMLLIFRLRKMQKVEIADLEIDKEILQKEEEEIKEIAAKDR